MIRSTQQSLDQDPNFRWRGGDVSRIENLSDIVFALSLSLLAVASSAPATFVELTDIFRSALAFAAAFAILLLIWHYHYIYFRRYGLNDGKTVFLNALLLFVVLLFVYPLRFLTDFIFTLIPAFFVGFDILEPMVRSIEDGRDLLIIYSFGYAAVFLIIAGMYGHALAKRDALDLDTIELILTTQTRDAALAQAAIALFVIAVAQFTPMSAWAGPLYFLSGPAEAWIRRKTPTPIKT
ncbi:MAG: DUF1211 domain-containing protein [Marinicaulis sp.]|nr:DUF1211 domain-containing protein [Marinicaulis sp.]